MSLDPSRVAKAQADATLALSRSTDKASAVQADAATKIVRSLTRLTRAINEQNRISQEIFIQRLEGLTSALEKNNALSEQVLQAIKEKNDGEVSS